MIKIKGQFENGAQMRQELLALLGMDGAQQPVAATKEQIASDVKALENGYEDLQRLEASRTEEKPKAKRKVAEALKANTGTEEPPASEVNVEATEANVEEAAPVAKETTSVAQETGTVAKTYTLDDAKLAAAKLSRTGPEFRNKAKDIAFKYAQLTSPSVDKDAALVPKIAPEHYEAFIAEIEEAGK